MTLKEKLKEQKDFTDSEKVLSNYILDNIDNISRLTIYQLSDNSFCSVATISRFCKKLKVKNFGLLKVELAKEASKEAINELDIKPNYPFTKYDGEHDIATKISSLCRHAISDAYNSLDYENLHNAAILLNEASHIDIYANWMTMVSAMRLHSKLLWIGKNSNLETLRGFQNVKAKMSTYNQLAVIVSYYGYNDINNAIAKFLHDNNTPYILITGPKINPLCINAKLVIHVPVEEDYTDKISAYSTEAALDYTIDVLYSFLFALNYDDNLNNKYTGKTKDGTRLIL